MRKKKRKKHTKIITKIVLFSGILIGGGIGIVTIMNCNVPEKRLMEYMKYIEKGEYEPFGCNFKTYLGDEKHSCANHCMFCFIDQLPPGMREPLYFKDDDERLSFLYGNYITMTNLTDREVERIIKLHISPIFISVHTTNPQLRVRMMANKRAAETLRYLDVFAKGGIDMNCQLVLCRGINDGDELRRTLDDLLRLRPQVESIAAVPAGVTDTHIGERHPACAVVIVKYDPAVFRPHVCSIRVIDMHVGEGDGAAVVDLHRV